jgi:hypothetical protein
MMLKFCKCESCAERRAARRETATLVVMLGLAIATVSTYVLVWWLG